MRMKKFLYIFLWWCAIVPTQLHAQHLTLFHIPLTTDSLYGYKMPYIAVADTGKNCVWDFSNLSMDSAEIIEVNYFAPTTDTMHIGLHREKANYYYYCHQDTLWQTGYETSRTHVQYPVPIPMLRFPFEYGDTIKGKVLGNGQYCHLLSIHTEGTYFVTADATGQLLLQGMTVDSVLRLHTIMQYQDSRSKNTTIQEERYLWYSPYCRYPLLETLLVQVIKESDTVSVSSTYYYPQEQEDVQERKDVEQDLQIELADSLMTEVSFMPNPVYTDLQVNYSLFRSAQVYISVHYNGGISTYQTPVRKEEEGTHSVTINMAGMPVGNYVVYIHADDVIASGSLIKL